MTTKGHQPALYSNKRGIQKHSMFWLTALKGKEGYNMKGLKS